MRKLKKTVAVVSTLDTKAAETYYLREQIERRGCRTLVIDLGTRGEARFPADVTREEIFALGNRGVAVSVVEDRVRLGEIMTDGAATKIKELYACGQIHAAIGLGGATNSLMETNIMRVLPFGVPKLMVSSVAASRGLASRYFGTADISIMHSVVDFTGLNVLTKDVLERAAGSITGMINVPEREAGLIADKNLIAITQLSLCERTAAFVRERLQEEGFQVIGFSATGVADKAMEELIERESLFRAVIDLAPGGVGENILGGTRSAGPNRLEVAGKNGVPQIIAPCGVNLMTPPRSKYKPEYYRRPKYDLDPLRTFLRLSSNELITVAQAMAQKLNMAIGPVKVLIPLRGWASFDMEGCAIYDPESDRIFTKEFRHRVNRNIEIVEVDANIDEPEFGAAVVQAFHDVMEYT
ncbi:hypothetical protein CEB3_c07050 [Peptococcaceae bacterium CEB3]|nr:hypothetical protein CEB3_c07050 [Peptococcaceae bacterium CEB3]